MESLRLSSITNQQSITAVASALRQERSIILSYFQNFTPNNQEILFYRRMAQQIGAMSSCLNRILFLTKQQQVLTSVHELYEVVGTPLSDITRKMRDNRRRLLREQERYNDFYQGFLQLQNTTI